MGPEQALFVLTGSLYGGMLLWLLWGLRRGRAACSSQKPAISIIVAARNEEEQIDRCLGALCKQDYEGSWEILVVDDRSTDGTAARIARRARVDGRVRLVRAMDPPRYRCPKKSALACGIEASTGELLLFTDADCRPPPGWARATVRRFSPDVGLVAGCARPDRGTTLRQHLLSLDNVAMGALAAGSFGMGAPLSCTGRNLAYRRAEYEQVGGFESIGALVGGDDVYFVRLLAARTKWRLVFNAEEAAVVACGPPPDRWAAILHQKLRHAGKAGHYQGPALWLGVSVYLFHALLAWSLIRAALGIWDPLAAGVWVGKFAADGALVGAMTTPSERRLLWALPLLEVLYLPYVLVFTVLGRMGWFRWKM